ncbi:hypothetical protein AVEN_111224-1 [Araneus ventricosus]|uniref:Uncharacterized protein n=1 Tax=Araneus ventricosus TaxID=182803 RepID=A0A4Y2EPS1_ARAVE|nr:hypothetical protein AVEN_111224-1 [Araneus ventricosus]
MKSLVYETPVDSAEDLVATIVVAADKINTTPGIFERVRQSFLRRCELCNDRTSTHWTFSSGSGASRIFSVCETPVTRLRRSEPQSLLTADKINTTPGIFERVRQSFLRQV